MRRREAGEAVRMARFLNLLHRWELAELNQEEAAELLGVPKVSHAVFHEPRHRPLRREGNDHRCKKRRLNPLSGQTLWTGWTSLRLAHPDHSRTEPEEADM